MQRQQKATKPLRIKSHKKSAVRKATKRTMITTTTTTTSPLMKNKVTPTTTTARRNVSRSSIMTTPYHPLTPQFNSAPLFKSRRFMTTTSDTTSKNPTEAPQQPQQVVVSIPQKLSLRQVLKDLQLEALIPSIESPPELQSLLLDQSSYPQAQNPDGALQVYHLILLSPSDFRTVFPNDLQRNRLKEHVRNVIGGPLLASDGVEPMTRDAYQAILDQFFIKQAAIAAAAPQVAPVATPTATEPTTTTTKTTTTETVVSTTPIDPTTEASAASIAPTATTTTTTDPHTQKTVEVTTTRSVDPDNKTTTTTTTTTTTVTTEEVASAATPASAEKATAATTTTTAPTTTTTESTPTATTPTSTTTTTTTTTKPVDAATPAEAAHAAADKALAEEILKISLEPLRMPKFFDNMKTGAIQEWHVKVGQHFVRGQLLCDIDTDIAELSFEAPEPGHLSEILVQNGESVAVGEAIAVLRYQEDTLVDEKH